MGKRTFSSELVHLLIVVLILCSLLCHTESALHSHHEPITGRKLKSVYRPDGDIYARPSSSGHGGGGHAKRLMSETGVGSSTSGHGGGGRHARRLMSLTDVGASSSRQGGTRIP